jgi:hypothetical protein
MLTFAPQIALTIDDLPTFGLPTSATKPLLTPLNLVSHATVR